MYFIFVCILLYIATTLINNVITFDFIAVNIENRINEQIAKYFKGIKKLSIVMTTISSKYIFPIYQVREIYITKEEVNDDHTIITEYTFELTILLFYSKITLINKDEQIL